jgi:hypothetical protein
VNGSRVRKGMWSGMNMDWSTDNIDASRITERYGNDDLVSGRTWSDFCDSLRRAGDLILRDDVPATPLNRATGFRHLMALLHIGTDRALAGPDPWHPDLGQVARRDAFKTGLDCPNALYRETPIKGDLTYRVWGNLGKVHFLSFQVNGPGGNLASIRGDQMNAAADGSFEMWIGPEPRCTVVPFSRIRDYLPASTPTVLPAERAATIAHRRAHVLRRFSLEHATD